ncbi:alpha/beta fold hydrolase [Sulfitobacter albidus]|uniref:alpha/beta fold hydrolase n=1 Tax=Sulfitobacter albidus TaxID=2829501 RepID=UPI0020C87F2A|nr:alpha/beta fold hydrolase [Sulfitobacter albidus]
MLVLLALIALLIAVVHWRASAREAQAAREYPPQGRIIDVDGVPVHVLTQGDGPDLVLIHGASGNVRDWTFDFVDRLSQSYRVVMIDRPGLGWTGRLPGKQGAWNARAESPAEQAQLLQRATDIIGVENPIVVGHSFGGAVAMAWALARPDETAGVVMLAAVSNPWPGDLGWNYTVVGSGWGAGSWCRWPPPLYRKAMSTARSRAYLPRSPHPRGMPPTSVPRWCCAAKACAPMRSRSTASTRIS